MYVFSVNAVPREGNKEFTGGEELPFIVYINFKDLFGAEQLCKLYLYKEGFRDAAIQNRKLIEERFLQDKKLIQADKSLREAMQSGYAIQLFEAH